MQFITWERDIQNILELNDNSLFTLIWFYENRRKQIIVSPLVPWGQPALVLPGYAMHNPHNRDC